MQLVYLVSSGIGVKGFKTQKDNPAFSEALEDDVQFKSIDNCGSSIILNRANECDDSGSWIWGKYMVFDDYKSARLLAKDVIDSQKKVYESLEDNPSNRKLHKVVGDLLTKSDAEVTMEGFPNRSWIATLFEIQDGDTNNPDCSDKVLIAYTVVVTELHI